MRREFCSVQRRPDNSPNILQNIDYSPLQQKNINMNPSYGLSTLITKVTFLSALEISCAVSVVVFALDSPEREKREGSTTPCGVKDVAGCGTRFSYSGPLGCGENRMSTSTDNNASTD